LAHLYYSKFVTKRYQNHQSLLNSIFIMPCETQHAYTCHNKRQLHRVAYTWTSSLSYPTLKWKTDQQCSAI